MGKVTRIDRVIRLNNNKKRKPTKEDFKRYFTKPTDDDPKGA